MFKHFIIVALRQILKRKFLSLILIIGLAFATAVTLLIFNYVSYELSFDKHHKHSDRIYRVIQENYNPENGQLEERSAATYSPVAPLLSQNLSSVISSSRVYKWSEGTLRKDVLCFPEVVYYSDPSFFEIFTVPFNKGGVTEQFKLPNKVVLSSKLAAKYFGSEDPIGKAVTLKDWFQNVPLEVVGVYENFPENSHFQPDVIASFASLDVNPIWKGELDNNWESNSFYSYVLLNSSLDQQGISKIESDVNELVGKNAGKDLMVKRQFKFQPLEDIHLRSDVSQELMVNGNGKSIYFLAVIGVLILIISWINFVNLLTANSIERSKEVGVKKALGASQKLLLQQFLTESIVSNIIALAFGLIITYIIFQQQWKLGLVLGGEIAGFEFWALAFLVFIVGVVLCNLYPSYTIATLNPKKFLKKASNAVRSVLVAFQFTISIALIFCTLVVFYQFNFLRTQNLGFKKDQVLIVKPPSNIREDSVFAASVTALKHQLEQIHTIKSIAGSSSIPGTPFGGSADIQRQDQKESYVVPGGIYADNGFSSVYGLQFAEGRFLDPNIKSAQGENSIVINESLSALLKFEKPSDAIGETIIKNGEAFIIVGVVKDFHYQNLKEHYMPLFFAPLGHPSNNQFLSLNVKPSDAEATIAQVKNIFQSLFNEKPEYFFVDEYFNQQYKEEMNFSRIFRAFTMVAIVLTALGLLGLSSYYASSRRKEIAVRKVYGAENSQIIMLLLRSFLLLIAVSAVIALPIAYFGISSWLQSFAFHIRLSWFEFLLPVIIMLGITLLAVGYELLKAAGEKPVTTLRNE